jgi:hypothetical protein
VIAIVEPWREGAPPACGVCRFHGDPNARQRWQIGGDNLWLLRHHRDPAPLAGDYGIASLSLAPIVAELMSRYSLTSLSDYGAGKKNLLRGLQDLGVHPSKNFPYDPVFPEYGDPKPADLACCIDMLEHVEPRQLDNVLAILLRSQQVLAYSPSTRPDCKYLSRRS